MFTNLKENVENKNKLSSAILQNENTKNNKIIYDESFNNNKNATGKTSVKSVRSIWYILSFFLLVLVTASMLVSLFTNYWQVTQVTYNSNTQYFTYGIFFACRQIQIYWLANLHNEFCIPINSSSSK